MGGKIDGYLDCTSPYSFFAITYLRKQRKLLQQYGVEVEFHPIFLGGVNVGSGNKPPWTVPAKAKYGPYDSRRAIKYFQTPTLSTPSFFPILSVVPQRAMLVVKALYPNETFERIFLDTWQCGFIAPHLDISKPANLATMLKRHLPDDEVDKVLQLMTTPKFKDQLTNNTKKVVEQGAFGAPWFWMRNAETGIEEPLFGSDRWAYMWDFMGVEFTDLAIVDRDGEGKAKL